MPAVSYDKVRIPDYDIADRGLQEQDQKCGKGSVKGHGSCPLCPQKWHVEDLAEDAVKGTLETGNRSGSCQNKG